MKSILFSVIVAVLLIGCHSQRNLTNELSSQDVEVVCDDTTTYDLIVFDAKFDTFLAMQARTKTFYSDVYYKSWNQRYSIEWNIRHGNPSRYGDFYQSEIAYDSTIDYGIDFNFKLYQYFQFIDQEYNIVLISRKGR